ncbi:MAG: hypothetical protein V1723_04455 [Candidatus Uhrbacteria bacterium]
MNATHPCPLLSMRAVKMRDREQGVRLTLVVDGVTFELFARRAEWEGVGAITTASKGAHVLDRQTKGALEAIVRTELDAHPEIRDGWCRRHSMPVALQVGFPLFCLKAGKDKDLLELEHV